ncbi:hypothetical protein P8452_50813 [Trifolium repens]|nr:hypothetical protein P8452_50813 [Trifolium repens]
MMNNLKQQCEDGVSKSRKDAFQDALAGPLGCELKARAMNTQMGGGVLKIRVMKKPKSKEPSAKRAKVGKGEKVKDPNMPKRPPIVWERGLIYLLF